VENFYIFQPSLLNNDATIFERSNPIQVKADGIPFALPETFDVFGDKIAKQPEQTEKPEQIEKPEQPQKIKELPKKSKANTVNTKINFDIFDANYLTIENINYVKSLIVELETNYNYIINVPDNNASNSNSIDNKFISYGTIIKLLQNNDVLNTTVSQKLAISILLDELAYDKTILLVNYLLNNGYNLSGLADFEKELLYYYNENLIISANNKLKALILAEKSEYKNYTYY
jgi:hypothetical protein